MTQKVFTLESHSKVKHLFIEISRNYLSVYSIDENNAINGLEIHTYNSSAGFQQAYQAISLHSILLNSQPAAVYVICNTAHATCIPASHFNEEATEYYRNLLNVDAAAVDYTATIKDVFVKYFVADEWLHTLKGRFASLNITHKYAVMINTAQDNEDSIHLAINQKEMLIMTTVSGKLSMINMYDYSTSDDVLYRLLLVCSVYKMHHHTVLLKLSGSLQQDSALFTQLYDYFGNMVLRVQDNFVDESKAAGFEAHFFTPYYDNIAYFKT